MTIKKLNKRQTKWIEFLTEFDFKIIYQLKKKNDKANSLTKRLEDKSIDESNDRNQHMHQIVLSLNKINSRLVQELHDTEKDTRLFLFDRVKTVNQKDRTCIEIRKVLQENKKSHNEMLLKKFKSIENTLFFKEKLWIFELNQLKLNIIKKIHDQSVSEHLDVRRTCKYLYKWYYWSQTKQSIKRYIRNCHICKKFKTIRDKYSNLLNSLFISNRSWTNIIINFVIELFDNRDFNVILMMINRLIKMHHYVFCIAEEDETFAKKQLNCWSITYENYTNCRIR
jgi:hypothetical protein